MRVSYLKKSPWMPIGLGLLIVIIDQILKFYVGSLLVPNESIPIFGFSWFRLIRVPNSGLLFQFSEMVLRPENELYVRYLPTLALIFLGIIFWNLKSTLIEKNPQKTIYLNLLSYGFSLLWLSGLSNVLSHWRSIFVDDTLAVQLGSGSLFYPFNLADLGIMIGLLMLCAFYLIEIFSSIQRQSL